jgi:hypothetical protein
MEWESLLADAVKDGCIRELHLRKLPVLKTTSNWRVVEPVGWINHQMKHSMYKGGLVKLNGKLYFVKEKTIQAVEEFIKFTFSKNIRVID